MHRVLKITVAEECPLHVTEADYSERGMFTTSTADYSDRGVITTRLVMYYRLY